MRKIFEFMPQKNVKKLSTTTSLLIIGAVILMGVTVLSPEMPYKWAIQLLAIGLLAMSVFIVARYIMKSFVYAVVETDEGTDLTVTEIQGRHTITVCRIAMSSIEQVLVVPQNDRPAEAAVKNQIKAEKRKVFNYCADLFADKYICIFSNESGTDIAVKLTWDASLEQLFEKNTEDARDAF